MSCGAKVVTSVKDLPAGFVRMADIVPLDHPRRKAIMPILSRAHITGKLEAYKVIRSASEAKMGAVYVRKDAALAIISAWETRTGIVTEAIEEVVKSIAVINPQAPAGENQLVLTDIAKMVYAISQDVAALRKEVADVKAACELQVEAVYMRVGSKPPALGHVVEG